MKTLKLAAILSALVSLALAPLSAQTRADSAHVAAQQAQTKILTSRFWPLVSRYCGTRKPAGYLCDSLSVTFVAPLLSLQRAESLLVIATTPLPPAPPPPIAVDSTQPELPRVFMVSSVASTPSPGRTLPVGTSLQAALDSARAGDVITLACPMSVTGNYTIRAKPGADASHWTTIRTSCLAQLPPEGTRVSPANVGAMSTILAANTGEGAFTFAPGASYYRVIGLEVSLAPAVTLNYGIVRIGEGGTAQTTLAQVPHHIVLDRVYVHGIPAANTQRCVSFNGAWLAVVDSYLSACHFAGTDAQAIGGWNGPGPFQIVNNYLEASGENILFGGADPSIAQLVPSDIEVRHNWIYKPLSWQGSVWTIKNLLECKNCQRMLVEGNVLENNWPAAQSGHAILTQALTDGNSAPWTTTKDLTFRLNIIRNAPICYDIVSRVAYNTNNTVPLLPDSASRRITFTNNLCENVGARTGFGVFGDLRHVHITHNTVLGIGNTTTMFSGDPMTGYVFANNLTAHGMYGMFGDSFGEGNGAITHYAPGAVITGNVLVGFPASLYPSGNAFPQTLTDVGVAADWSLLSTSSYKGKATDGTDPGANIAAILTATRGVVVP